MYYDKRAFNWASPLLLKPVAGAAIGGGVGALKGLSSGLILKTAGREDIPWGRVMINPIKANSKIGLGIGAGYAVAPGLEIGNAIPVTAGGIVGGLFSLRDMVRSNAVMQELMPEEVPPEEFVQELTSYEVGKHAGYKGGTTLYRDKQANYDGGNNMAKLIRFPGLEAEPFDFWRLPLIGAAGGAAVGGTIGAVRAAIKKEKMLKSITRGVLLGAGTGFGATYGYNLGREAVPIPPYRIHAGLLGSMAFFNPGENLGRLLANVIVPVEEEPEVDNVASYYGLSPYLFDKMSVMDPNQTDVHKDLMDPQNKSLISTVGVAGKGLQKVVKAGMQAFRTKKIKDEESVKKAAGYGAVIPNMLKTAWDTNRALGLYSPAVIGGGLGLGAGSLLGGIRAYRGGTPMWKGMARGGLTGSVLGSGIGFGAAVPVLNAAQYLQDMP